MPDEPSGASPGPGRPVAARLVCSGIVRSILSPEFDEYYRELERAYEEDLTDEVVLNELADFVSDLLAQGGPEPLIERCCQVFEAICADGRIDPVATLYDQVLLCLSPSTFERLRSYFGPATEALVEEMGEA